MKKNIASKIGLVSLGTLMALTPLLTTNNVTAASNNSSTSNTIYQKFPIDYVDDYLDGIQTELTIPSYELPAETDGYWRTFDEFLSKDMTTWLGQTNLSYAKNARNSMLTDYFLYRLSPADDDFPNFAGTVDPDLKQNGGTAKLKLQVLNKYNSGQVVRELPINVKVTTPSQDLNVSYQAKTTLTSDVTPQIFKNVYQLPKFTITDENTGLTYKATNISPVSNVYIDGKKTELTDLPKTLAKGTYSQSIFFTVDGMSPAELQQLSASGQIKGNDGAQTIRYSNGQLIAARTIVVE